MPGFKRFFNTLIPVRRCNLICHYCYLQALDVKHGDTNEELCYSLEHIEKALSPERLGGICMFNLCAEGETLLFKRLSELTEMLLRLGHFVTVVTNAIPTAPLERLLNIDIELRQRLFIKCSFQFLELKRLNLMDKFFKNVNLIKHSGTAFTVELTANDESVPFICEIKDLCLKNLGALCHIIESRDQSDDEYGRMTKLRLSEHQRAWSSFDSPLFDYQQKSYGVPQKEFCYAGELYASFNIQTGDCKQCINKGKKFTNLYENIEVPVKWVAIGRNCPLSHCYITYHAGFPLVNCYPEEPAATYAEERDRLCADGSRWLTPFMRDTFSHRCSEMNKPYSARKSAYINALMGMYYFGREPEQDENLLIAHTIKEEAKRRGIHSVAVYGMHNVGKWMIRLLKSAGVDVKFGIDRRADKMNCDIPVIHPQDKIPETDAIIVAAFGDFTNIQLLLREKTLGQILSAVELVTNY